MTKTKIQKKTYFVIIITTISPQNDWLFRQIL